jgi:long-chain acyl-CoA synthetase
MMPRGGALLEAWSNWRGSIETTDTIWSATELRRETARALEALENMEVKAGHRVAILLSNGPAFPIWLMACLEIGANPVLLGVGTKPAELKRHASGTGLHWAIHNPEDPTSRFSDLEGMAIGNEGGEKTRLLPLSAAGSKSIDEGALLHPTSGTYGNAQFCIRNQDVAVAEARNFLAAIDCYDRCRVRITTPLSHAFAFGFGLVASLLSHSILVVDRIFNPRRLLSRETEECSDIIALVPSMINILSTLGKPGESGMAAVAFYAGAPCPLPGKKAFEETFGTRLHAIYGTTETGAISTSYRPDHREMEGVGRALPGVDISIRNQSAYHSLRPGVGEVWIRSTSFMQGYLDAPFEGDEGYFNTRDLGVLHQGTLTLVGRIKDMINLGGRKVDPSEVEAVLNKLPQVVEVAVYPGVDGNGSEFVQAAMQLAPGEELDTEVLTAICAQYLEAFKLPRRYHRVEALPRSPSGKCLKFHCPDWGTAS